MSAAAHPGRPRGPHKRRDNHNYGTRKSSLKSPRSRAREFALQGLYQHFVGGGDAASIDAFTRALQGFNKVDAVHFDTLLHGCLELAADLDALIVPHLDRELGLISPIEHACMWIGTYEMLRCPDIPWRVALNESIELAKDFGGTDGYKYVNAVLNAIAPQLRPLEVAHDRGGRANAAPSAAVPDANTAPDANAEAGTSEEAGDGGAS